MKKEFLKNALRSMLIVGDIAINLLAFCSAYYFRFHSDLFPKPAIIPGLDRYLIILVIVLLLYLTTFHYLKLYRNVFSFSLFSKVARIVISVSISIAVFMALTFWFRDFTYSRILVMLFWGTSIALLLFWRIVYFFLVAFLQKNDIINSRVLIIGANENTKMFIQRIKREIQQRYKVIGIISDSLEKGTLFEGNAILGGRTEFSNLLLDENIDMVFIADADYRRNELAGIIMSAPKVSFMIAEDPLSLITRRKTYNFCMGMPVLQVRELPLDKAFNRFFKRVFDVTAASIALLILSPLFTVIAGLIKVTSKGPVFYRQKRISRGNVEFTMLKFRTMKVDAESNSGPVWARKDDNRTTLVGGLLRKASIDELPQLINILKGDMSFVGPRPERKHFVEQFKEVIPQYNKRHMVQSGLTGWAQANGLRGNTSLEERIKYDLYYIENWSLWFDIKICIKTILEVFHHDSAY